MKDSVTLLIPSMKGGGTERAIFMLANYWAQSGYAVTLILFRCEGPLLDFIDPKVEIESLESDQPLVQIWRLKRYLCEHSPETLLCALNPANVVAVCARILARRDTRVIACVQNHLGAKYQHLPSVLNPLRRFVIGWALNRANCVVAVSCSISDYLINVLGVGTDKISVIYNPVEILSDTAIKQLTKPIHSFFESSSAVILIAAGRLTRQKNFQLLIRAMAHLPNHVRLILLGDGEDRRMLEGLILELDLTERISLPGFQINPLNWFAQADCYVMTSDWEGFPFVLLEAMSVGLQVVSTDCLSGPVELLQEGTGILAEPGNVDSLVASILTAIEHPVSSEVLRDRASDFSIQKIADQYAELLH